MVVVGVVQRVLVLLHETHVSVQTLLETKLNTGFELGKFSLQVFLHFPIKIARKTYEIGTS